MLTAYMLYYYMRTWECNLNLQVFITQGTDTCKAWTVQYQNTAQVQVQLYQRRGTLTRLTFDITRNEPALVLKCRILRCELKSIPSLAGLGYPQQYTVYSTLYFVVLQ